ncbi:hypothetical protein PCE1_001519 [Barthelona sp. PCE]
MLSTKYSSSLNIPEGFPLVLKNFLREVLRAQPSNIYEFGATHFQKLYKQQQETVEDVFARFSEEELASLVADIFKTADADGNGFLDLDEMHDLLNSDQFGFSKRQVRRLIIELDENDDGVISYEEFAPLVVAILSQMPQMSDTFQDRKMLYDSPIHGYQKREFDNRLMSVFEKVDVEKTGKLTKANVYSVLRSSELNFSRHEINFLIQELPNVDMVDYTNFVGFIFYYLLDGLCQGILYSPLNVEDVERKLTDTFAVFDSEGRGCFDFKMIRNCLRKVDLGLSEIQIDVIMGEVEFNEDNLIVWRQFVPIASRIIYNMINLDVLSQHGTILRTTIQSTTIHELSGDNLRRMVKESLLAYDENKNGNVLEEDALRALHNVDIPFTPGELSVIRSCCFPTSAEVNIELAVEKIWETLLYLEMHSRMTQILM